MTKVQYLKHSPKPLTALLDTSNGSGNVPSNESLTPSSSWNLKNSDISCWSAKCSCQDELFGWVVRTWQSDGKPLSSTVRSRMLKRYTTLLMFSGCSCKAAELDLDLLWDSLPVSKNPSENSK